MYKYLKKTKITSSSFKSQSYLNSFYIYRESPCFRQSSSSKVCKCILKKAMTTQPSQAIFYYFWK